jgi:hypothetical protein
MERTTPSYNRISIYNHSRAEANEAESILRVIRAQNQTLEY